MKPELSMPEIVLDTDFSLDDEIANKNVHDQLWARHSEIMTNTDRNLFYRVGDHQNGWYAGYDKRIGLLYYLVQIKRLNKRIIGQSVTQTLVWRWHKSALASGITTQVIFGVLLGRYTTLMSDKLQTLDGKRFWERLLSLAFERGYSIGIVNLQTKKIIVPEPGEYAEKFIDRMNASVWGYTQKYQAIRPIISRNQIKGTE